MQVQSPFPLVLTRFSLFGEEGGAGGKHEKIQPQIYSHLCMYEYSSKLILKTRVSLLLDEDTRKGNLLFPMALMHFG